MFIWNSILQKLSGVFHIAGLDTLTIYEFTKLIRQAFVGESKGLERASIKDFPALAPRPQACWYVLDKLEALGHAPLSAQDGLTLLNLER